jgi:hypothetical protein
MSVCLHQIPADKLDIHYVRSPSFSAKVNAPALPGHFYFEAIES